VGYLALPQAGELISHWGRGFDSYSRHPSLLAPLPRIIHRGGPASHWSGDATSTPGVSASWGVSGPRRSTKSPKRMATKAPRWWRSVDKFSLVFNNLLEPLFVERMDQNEDIFARFMNEESFRKVIGTWMASEVYRKLKDSAKSPVVDPVSQSR
jgi:hypothetical protein